MTHRLHAARLVAIASYLAAWSAPPGARPPAAGDPILVVTTSGVSAYDEVLAGLRQALGEQFAPPVIDIRQRSAAQAIADALRARSTRLVVAIGSEAAEAVLAEPVPVPVIATTVMPQLLARDSPARPRFVLTVPVDVPFSALLENIRRVFPRQSRLGIIRNSTAPVSGRESLKVSAEAAGLTIRVADTAGPNQLLQTLLELKDQVDLVLCFPDGALYNSATVKPLVLASLRYRLPLVAFSESFARAGAALSVYPDFHDVGCQTAELVRKTLNGQPVSKIEYPRKFKVAVNQNITRLLGISYTQPAGLGEEFVVIR